MKRLAIGVALMLVSAACTGDASTATTGAVPDSTVATTTVTQVPTTEPLPPTTTTSTTTTSPPPWTIPVGSGTQVRGLHMTGNNTTMSATNDADQWYWTDHFGFPDIETLSNIPDEWLDWARDVNANWVGISILLSVSDTSDSTVSAEYSWGEWGAPTFTDQQLSALIGPLREHGFNVYMTLALDTYPWEANPAGAFGNPNPDSYWGGIDHSEWRWNPSHPEHETFLAEFFETYTQQAVHFAEIAEREGVSLFSLGNEMPDLFNVVASPTNGPGYRDELVSMVDAVRAVYDGQLTYNQFHGVLEQYGRQGWPLDRDQLWEVLGLDVIGLSWYMQLVDRVPTEVLGVPVLEQAWREIYEELLVTLADRHPDLPVMLTEFGYVNSIVAPYNPNIASFLPMCFEDGDGDGDHDGNQTRANALAAFFNVADEYPGIVDGVFLWGNMIGTDQEWLGLVSRRTWIGTRGPGEDVVREGFSDWRGAVSTDAPPTPDVSASDLRPMMCVDSDTTLTQDYFGDVVITADDVTLNCDGHEILGSAPSPPFMPGLRHAGIELTGRSGVTVENCVVSGFEYGFWVLESNSNRFIGNDASNNGTGFVLSYSASNELRDNQANNNTSIGFDLGEVSWLPPPRSASGVRHSSDNTLIGNTADNNGSIGFRSWGMSSNNTFEDNRACGSGSGIDAREAWDILGFPPSGEEYPPSTYVGNEFCVSDEWE